MRSPQTHSRTLPELTFEAACEPLEAMIEGATRQEIAAELLTPRDTRLPLQRLRDCMRAHRWSAGARTIHLGRVVKAYDRLTREDGFHALNDWDGKADRVNADIIPVDVLHYLIERRRQVQPHVSAEMERTAVAILVDYYLMHLLSLLTLRIWGDGDADENLDRVDRLLHVLQGPGGSGQQFSADAETLLLIATSHFEIHEWGYGKLLVRTRTLNQRHRVNIALGHAASMGSHLRFGFEATYARDTVVMRNDNVADYPWLCFALSTLMHEYDRLTREDEHPAEREAVVEALLNGLTPDARAFIGAPPSFLSAAEIERLDFVRVFGSHRDRLLDHFERYRPSSSAYSPISLFFNFSHNIVKGMVIDALLSGEVWRVTLNDLLTSHETRGVTGESKIAVARTLMGYARANPDRIGGRLKPVIVYDPAAGRQAFGVTMRKLRE